MPSETLKENDSLLISHKKKFVFIHIYKNSGSSITSVFLRYCSPLHYLVNKRPYNLLLSIINYFFGLMYKGNKWVTGFRKHALATEVKEKIGEEIWLSYYKFAFVRNPYSHVESLYLYIQQNKNHKYSALVGNMSFDEFVNFYCSGVFFLQNNFVCEENSVIVDYVGHVENLQSDLESIHKDIGIEFSQECPTLNKSKRKNKNLWGKVLQDTLLNFNTYVNLDFKMFNYNSYESIGSVCKESRSPNKKMRI